MRQPWCCALALASLIAIGSPTASAAGLIYRPVNPSFGGNALNSGHLLSIANAEKPTKKTETPTRATQSSTDRFKQILQSRLLSSLAFDVTEMIFGEDAQESGEIVFDGLNITFDNSGDEVSITIFDESTGELTEIVVPTLVQ